MPTLKSIIPGSTVQPKQESKQVPTSTAIQRMLAMNFDFTTTLLIGAALQGALLLFIPRIWVLFPTLIILLSRTAKTAAITLKLIPNPQMKDAIFYRTTAVIPDTEGEFNKEGSGSHEKITVLLLSMRQNHPLGFFAPGLKKLGALNEKMSAALDRDAPHNGFLGQTQYMSKSAEGSNDLLLISYWRSIEDVLNFANGPEHRETWAWWEANADDLKHLGISHEIYQADRNAYESVFMNFQPTRIGATSYFRRGDKMMGGTVPDQWVNPLVDARKGKLRTSHGRLGWSSATESTTEKSGY